jgi:hypothetical protein
VATDWLFFILLNATLFIRPADLIRSADLPVYNIFMIACLLTLGTRVLAVTRAARQSPHGILTGPVSPAVIGKLTRGACTPTGRLDLKPGELVRIKTKREIEETLDERRE